MAGINVGSVCLVVRIKGVKEVEPNDKRAVAKFVILMLQWWRFIRWEEIGEERPKFAKIGGRDKG
ncbi:hypothetical protein DTL42_16655 [Bremerella cremea]|uniref:Uncharacterized protein n=1 Tax=Bremerella cremea TaxID=1031537 RepID=A0A368KNU4_9BACT|nr:hypothetical protein DTL42_16655 [Bremerella cremea]